MKDNWIDFKLLQDALRMEHFYIDGIPDRCNKSWNTLTLSPDTTMKRLFLAIDLPERIIEDVAATYQAIHGAQWVSDDRLHVTLRFFGDTAPDREQTIIRAMQKISFEPFALQLRGVGHFPPRREARILWVGIDDQPVLLRLQSNIGRACVNAGFPPDRRRFSPHITVARLTGVSPDRVAQFIVTNSLFATEHFEIHEFHLYSSCLGKDGAKYTKEVTFLSSRRN